MVYVDIKYYRLRHTLKNITSLIKYFKIHKYARKEYLENVWDNAYNNKIKV